MVLLFVGYGWLCVHFSGWSNVVYAVAFGFPIVMGTFWICQDKMWRMEHGHRTREEVEREKAAGNREVLPIESAGANERER
jgi:hypothetical protein